MQEGNPPPPNKPRPPLVTRTTTVEKKQDKLPSGKPGPVQRTVVTRTETTTVKPPPKAGQ